MQAGLDSLGAVELRNAIASKFSISVPATLAFDYPTPAALAEFVAAKVPSRQGLSGGGPHHAALEETQDLPFDSEDIKAKIHAIVCAVLGSSISVDQPFMEVPYLSYALLLLMYIDCIPLHTSL